MADWQPKEVGQQASPARPAYESGRLDRCNAQGIYRFYQQLEKRNEKKAHDIKAQADGRASLHELVAGQLPQLPAGLQCNHPF